MTAENVLDYFYESDEFAPPSGTAEINRGRWTKREKRVFEEGFKRHGKEWKLIASMIKTRTVIQIRTHAQKYFQKLAKQTGGPVMSTSKKERLPPSVEAASAAAESLKQKSSLSLKSRKDSGQATMTLRKRQFSESGLSDDEESDSDFEPTMGRRRKISRIDSVDNLAGSSSERESDFGEEDDTISKELEFYNRNSFGPVEKEKAYNDSGRITPRMVAAATLLMAPRFNSRISEKRIIWARSLVADEF